MRMSALCISELNLPIEKRCPTASTIVVNYNRHQECCFLLEDQLVTRIFNAYSAKFRALLLRVGARKLQKGINWFSQQAEQLESQELSPSEALERVYQKTRRRIAHSADRFTRIDRVAPVVFVCDVGLGGLARWLRAAGY